MPNAPSVTNDLIAQCVRARQRRAFMLGTQQDRLAALTVVEAQIERNIKALTLLPSAAEQAFGAQLQTPKSPHEQDALVHVRGAFLAQQPPSQANHQSLLSYLQQYLAAHRIAVRDALWFFPTQSAPFEQTDQHLDLLLNCPDESIVGLGIELVGRHASRRCTPRVRQGTRHGSHQSLHACELALARCAALSQPETAIRKALKSDQIQHALRLVGITGQIHVLSCADYLLLTRHPDSKIQRHAWLLASICDPLATQRHTQRAEMDPRLRAHVLAMCGYVPDLIATLRAIDQSDEPPSSFQREHLWLTLGSMDISSDALPLDANTRRQALRAQLLNTLRRCHLGIHNHADVAPWESERIVLSDDLRHSPRLRFGQVPRSKTVFDQRMAELSAELRQALYVEQGAHTGGTQALSASSPARLQNLALGCVQWIDEHLEYQG